MLKYTVDKGYVGKDDKWGYGLLDVERMIMAKNDPSLNLPIYVEPEDPKEPKSPSKTHWWQKAIDFFRGK